MIRRPPRSTLDRSSAASDVYKRQDLDGRHVGNGGRHLRRDEAVPDQPVELHLVGRDAVSYTHLRAHETVLDLVCRLLLEQKNNYNTNPATHPHNPEPHTPDTTQTS